MKFFYISKSTFFNYLFLFCLLAVFSNVYLLLLLILLFGLALFLFRKKKVRFTEDQVTTIGTVYAPVTGAVLDIWESEDKSMVSVITNLFDEYGIYMPCSGEVSDLTYLKDSFIYRVFKRNDYKDKYLAEISFRDKLDNIINVRFLRFFSSSRPQFVALPGDRGRRMANIGYLPFGGITTICLPKEYKIELKKNDNIYATESIIARIVE